MDIASDFDPLETAEWRDALDSVLAFEGPERGHFILSQVTEEARLAARRCRIRPIHPI